MPATAPTTRSAPSCAGLSITMLNPVFIPGPTTITFFPIIFSAADFTLPVTDGTTEAIIAPSMSFSFTLYISRIFLNKIANSSAVRLLNVDNLSTKLIFPFSPHPMTIFVFPISIERII